MAHPVYKLKDGTEVMLDRSSVHQALLEFRFLSHVEWTGDCWLWMASKNIKGYGVFWDGFRNRPAHRWAYEHWVEIQPKSLVMDHLCRNRACVNPDHLEPVLQRTNVLRGNARAAIQARQTHCVNGHELRGSNVYIKPNGARQCITCRRQTDKKRHAHS